MLNDVKVRTAGPGTYADGKGDGLRLRVRPNGTRFWVQRVTINGKPRELGHGSYPTVTLATARKAAAAAKETAQAGTDPLEEKRAAKADRAEAAERTLEKASEEYLAAHAAAWRSEKTEVLFRRSLAQHAAGLMARPIGTITLDDVRRVLLPIWTTTPVLAGKVRSRLEATFEWATAAGWRSGPNPAAWRNGLRPLLARPSSVHTARHHPALAWQRLPAFLDELADHSGTAARCLELAIYTAGRSGETRGAVWSEIDLAAALWTIPAGRMKAAKEHRVPLNASALTLLRDMRAALTEDEGAEPRGLVFPGPKGNALSDMSLLKVILTLHTASLAAGGDGWCDDHGQRITPHGFRSTFRSWCGDKAHPRELAEAALAHAVGSATERAYARSDLLDRRAVLMADWSVWCESQPALGIE